MGATVDPRYPIGAFAGPEIVRAGQRESAMSDIAALPAALQSAVAGLTDEQLDTPYREGGWTVRQLVHHVADSHMNCFTRVRLALTENNPTIKPYDEGAWAQLADSRTAPVQWSLELLEALHARWSMLLRAMTEDDWQRRFLHPENGENTLDQAMQYYGWHCRHHVAHVLALRAGCGW